MTSYPLVCRIRAEGSLARLDILDDIGGDPFWGGGISAADVAGQLAGMRGPLDVHISSQGGIVGDGLAIYNALSSYPGRVTTYVDGYALSVASVIAQAGQKRVASPVSALMIHDAWGFADGDQAEMLRMAAALGTNSEVIARAYADRAGGSVDEWRDRMRATTWYTADEALAAGLVDEVSGGSRLPAGLDVEALAARAPERIMARLRAAAPPAGNHPPFTGTHSHAHPAYGDQGGDATHEHEHEHHGDADHGHSHVQDRGTSPRGAAGDETPVCQTCGGRGKLKHPSTGQYTKPCPSCEGSGLYDPAEAAAEAHGHPGRPCMDPDGDGDCDTAPGGDTDHDYWSAEGTALQPLPGEPMDAGRAAVRAELRSLGLIRDAIPDGVKSQFQKEVKEDSVSDVASAVHRLSQWAGSGHYPQGCTYDDLKWFYDECCAELKRRDPDSEAGGNFPPEPRDSARAVPQVFDCRALTNALAAIAQAAGGGESKDKGKSDFSRRLEQMRAAMPPLRGAGA